VRPFLFSAPLIAGLLLAGGAGARQKTSRVVVPDVSGLRIESAYAQLHRAGLRVSCTCAAISAGTAATSEDPTAGTAALRGSTITIGISAPAPAATPAYRRGTETMLDLTHEPAGLALAWANTLGARWVVTLRGGLRDANATGFFDNFVVAGQDPSPGSTFEPSRRVGPSLVRATVTFRVRQSRASAGRDEGLVRVPDLVSTVGHDGNVDFDAAYERLHREGLVVTCGPVEYGLAPDPRVGLELPRPGTLVPRGSTVILAPSYGPPFELAITSGPATVVPNLVGGSPLSALAWAGTAHILASLSYGALRQGGAADFAGNFVVATQQPLPGVSIPGGARPHDETARFTARQAA